jgi:hypothetical protein
VGEYRREPARESNVYILSSNPLQSRPHIWHQAPTSLTMDQKNEVAHIEEKATHDSDSTSTQLLCSDGVVLIPQPTADPNGESPYGSSAQVFNFICPAAYHRLQIL